MNFAQQMLQEDPDLMNKMVMDYMARKRVEEAAKFKDATDFNIQDNPKLRAFQAYPRALYHWPTRTNQEVTNKAEHDAALAAGWKEDPWPVVNGGAPTPTAVGDAEDTSERLDLLERQMFDMHQMMGEILERLPKPKKAEAVKP